MTKVALMINHYFTPARRQAVNRLLALAGVFIVVLQPEMSEEVEDWTQVLYGAASVFMLVIAAIVTRSPQWPAIYSGIAALLTALVGVSVLTQTFADSAARIAFLVIQAIPSFMILARIQVSDPIGSPDGVPRVNRDGNVDFDYPDGTTLVPV